MLYVSVMCTTFHRMDNELEAYIKSVLILKNINYLKIKKEFYHGNNYITVALNKEEDRDILINSDADGSPKFIACSDLNKTLREQQIRLFNLPNFTITIL